MAATNFAVLPLRKLVPSLRGYDSATMLLAWLVSMVSSVIILALNPMYTLAAPETWLALVPAGHSGCVQAVAHLADGCGHRAGGAQLGEPLQSAQPHSGCADPPVSRPFRRATVGGVDLSPLILFLIIQVMLMLPVQFLENSFLMQLKVVMQ
jgi:YggT family protein